MNSEVQNQKPNASPARGFALQIPHFGILISLLLGIITLFVYLPVRHHDFVLFDDADYVTDNRMVQSGLTWSGVKWAFTTGHSGNWHPLTWLSHMVDAQLFGAGAAGPHLVNVLFHVTNTVLLLLLLRRLTGALWRSALVAALFALHPLHVESVAWVAERKDVLSGFFFLLTLLAYRSYTIHKTYKTYLLTLFLFVLGLMSKPMLVTVPFVMLLLDYWPLRRLGLRKVVWEKIPLFVLSAASCVVTFLVQQRGGTVRSLASFPLSDRIGNAFVSYGQYLGRTVWPVDLAVFYPHPGHWPAAAVILAALLVCGACIGALLFGRRFPFAATGWFWFLGMMIPTIGLVQVSNQSMADRYTYLPLVGVFILLVWGAGEVFARGRPVKVAVGIAAGLVVLACAARTAVQLRFWRDGESLFRQALAVTKGNFVAQNYLGNALLQKGEVDEAIVQFRAALEIRPDYADACCNLGSALLRKNQVGEATVQFRKALELQPDHALARYDLATVLLQGGQVDEAIVQFEKAVQLRPDDASTRINYGNALLQSGKVDGAIVQYRKVVELQPDSADAHNNLGAALFQQGRMDEAVNHFERALELQPGHANARNNLAGVYLQQGQMDKAIVQYEKLLAIEPRNAEARNNLANALIQQGKMDDALVHLRKVLEIRPDFAEAHNNLGYVLFQSGRAREAIEHYEAALKLQPANARTLSSLAWVLATCPEASIRNGPRALELAQRADQLSNGQDPMVLHSLAAACAETGRFTEAMTAAQRALKLADAQSNAVLAEMLRSELKSYQAGTPFRDNGSK